MFPIAWLAAQTRDFDLKLSFVEFSFFRERREVDMSLEPLTFLAFGRVKDGTLLGRYSHETTLSDQNYTEETFRKILHAAKFRLRPGGRQKLVWGSSTVSILVSFPEGDVLYGVVSSSFDYPERLSYQLLNEVAAQVEKEFSSTQIAQARELSLSRTIDLSRLLKAYQDPVSIDKIAAVQAKTNNLRTLMQANIRDIMKNTEQVEVLHGDVRSIS